VTFDYLAFELKLVTRTQ